MATTPEGKVKKAIKAVLDAAPDVWYFMPVPYADNGIPDFIICVDGRFVAIEAKAPGKHPTKLQLRTLDKIAEAGGTTLVVDTTELSGMHELLDNVRALCA